jgi:hypothetical protein
MHPKTLSVRVIAPFVIGGGKHAAVGQLLELPYHFALEVLSSHKVEEVPPAPAPSQASLEKAALDKATADKAAAEVAARSAAADAAALQAKRKFREG